MDEDQVLNQGIVPACDTASIDVYYSDIILLFSQAHLKKMKSKLMKVGN